MAMYNAIQTILVIIGKDSRTLGRRWDEWFETIDPGSHHRIKGLRLVTAYALAAMGSSLVAQDQAVKEAALLVPLAGAFALWASVSEGETSRWRSSRDLFVLILSATLGAAVFVLAQARFGGTLVPELTLVLGAFFVGYLRRFGRLGTGVGSQIFIGIAVAFGFRLSASAMPLILAAGLIALPAAMIPRLLSGPAEHSESFVRIGPSIGRLRAEAVMGLQAALPALLIVVLNSLVGLTEPVWAITACTYVVAGTSTATILRIRLRLIGTLIGVTLGLILVPVIDPQPLLVWAAAALAMMIYAIALPGRYDIACGAFAFALMITMALGGAFPTYLLASRGWETLLGCSLGFVTAKWLIPLRSFDTP